MDRESERYVILLRLSVVFLVSILGLVFIEQFRGQFWVDLIFKGLEALAIGSAIGILLDTALKRELFREAFFASVGYVLPKELQREMRWLCTLRELCISDTIHCTLSFVSADLLKLEVKRTQVVKNICNEPLPVPIGLSIDEWLHPGKESKIKKLAYVTNTQSWPDDGRLTDNWIHRGDFTLTVDQGVPPAMLEKNGEVKIYSEFEEFYPVNSFFRIGIKYPTNNFNITVDKPDDLIVDVAFAHREGHTTLRAGNHYSTSFTLLPYQHIGVRFGKNKN